MAGGVTGACMTAWVGLCVGMGVVGMCVSVGVGLCVDVCVACVVVTVGMCRYGCSRYVCECWCGSMCRCMCGLCGCDSRYV